MKIKNSAKNYVDIKIKYGPSFEYELPNSYEQFQEDFMKNGYQILNGELYYLNSKSQKIIIKSKNDFISLKRKLEESGKKIELIYEKNIIDSSISDLDFLKIQNVYSDLNTEESILELSQNLFNDDLDIINEADDKEYYSNGLKIIMDLLKRKYFLELIIKIKGKDLKKEEKIPTNKLSSSINLEYKFPSIENFIKKSEICFINNDEEILDELYNHYEKLEEIRNDNSIYQTMINNNSKLSLLKKENLNLNNDDNKNQKIYETQINQNCFFYECNNCHINPIKNIRYKCAKCMNYNLCEICEEKNYQNSFHPHSEFIEIRINKNVLENPYSYQCLTKNLVFYINKEEIEDDQILIKNILIKNNFILPWPGNNNTFFKCDKSLSTIFCETIYLPNLSLGNATNIDFVFLKANKMSKGEYKCICNFFVYNIKYCTPLELNIILI